MSINYIEFGTPEYDEAVALRCDILRKPIGRVFEPEHLLEEYSDTILGCYDAQAVLVGCLHLSKIQDDTLKMRQVAVKENQQGKGIGRKLVEMSEAFARRYGYTKIVLHARQVAIDFYLRLDYTIVGEPFEEVGIPHRKMEKKI